MIWFYRLLLPAIWLNYLVYWGLRSRGVKRALRTEPTMTGRLRALMLWMAILLISFPIPPSLLEWKLCTQNEFTFWSGTLVTVAGLLFSVWARQHLAGNWSQSVTIKENHELITSGPYRLARHPIYTGLLTGFLGTAIVVAELRAMLALALVTLALCMKLRLEEKWMRDEFGEKYVEYARRVAALIPGVL
jgi:protein-S-isoprenylcysteine O-methyltransferase Ste14